MWCVCVCVCARTRARASVGDLCCSMCLYISVFVWMRACVRACVWALVRVCCTVVCLYICVWMCVCVLLFPYEHVSPARYVDIMCTLFQFTEYTRQTTQTPVKKTSIFDKEDVSLTYYSITSCVICITIVISVSIWFILQKRTTKGWF